MSNSSRTLAFLLITGAAILTFAATDLILPAVPMLPEALGATVAQAQYVLASFVIGFAAGLLVFGELGARMDQRALLAGGLLLLAACSFLAAWAPSIEALIALRAAQGLGAAAAPALAPGVIRTIYPEPHQAVRAFGVQGSIEGLVPALAPVLGAWMLTLFSWRALFDVLGAWAIAAACTVALLPGAAFPARSSRAHGSYLALLRNREFVRFGLSQALTLGGLLVFVFGAPAVMVRVLGGTLSDFIVMQMLGVASFICAANFTGALVKRYGAERMVMSGSVLSAAGTVALLAYALAGGVSPRAVAMLFIPINLGLGLRGPPGFHAAIAAAGGDDARGAALVILAILLTTGAGTLAVASMIASGLVPLAAATALISVASVIVLVTLRRR